MRKRNHWLRGGAALIAGGWVVAFTPMPSALAAMSAPTQTTTVDGTTYYEISSVGQLQYIDQNQTSQWLSANYLLMNDIDMSSVSSWVPFGGNSNAPYSGTFNGQGHEITKFSMTTDHSDKYIGFFGQASGTIEHVGIDASVQSNNTKSPAVGGLVGQLESGGSISDSYETGPVIINNSYNTASGVIYGTGGSYAGGLVGAQYGTISNSHASGKIGAGDDGKNGGLVGVLFSGSIKDSYYTSGSTAFVFDNSSSGSGNDTANGGLVGWQQGGSISDSYATGSAPANAIFLGSVSGSESKNGGLVGRQSGGSITNSYATESVAGTGMRSSTPLTFIEGYNGGLVGEQDGGTITDSYASNSVTGSGSHTNPGQPGPVEGTYGSYSNVSVNGGLVGYQTSGGITNSHATGDVEGYGGTGNENGGLMGKQDGGSVTGSYATGSVTDSGHADGYNGGLVGLQQAGTIADSYATGILTVDGGNGENGGLVGNQQTGIIKDSYANVSVIDKSGGNAADDGGLVGYQQNGNIINGYARGSVSVISGNGQAGGLVGLLSGGSITNSYATGLLSGGTSVGGLVGEDQPSGVGGISASYFDTATTGQSTGSVAIGKNTNEMQQPSTFTTGTNKWSTSDWVFFNGYYPLLAWQINSTMSVSPTAVDVGGQVTVTGSVYSGETPLSGVNVTLSDDAGGSWLNSTVTTDSSGNYTDTWTAPNTTTSATVTASVYGTNIQHQSTVAVQGDTTAYTVTFNTNGGSAVTSETVAVNGTATKPADPTKNGYTFAGWFSDSGLTTPYHFSTTVTGSETLYAKWTANSTVANGLSISANPTVASPGTHVTVSGAASANSPVSLSDNGGAWDVNGASVTSVVYSVYADNQGAYNINWTAPTTPGVYTVTATVYGNTVSQPVDVTSVTGADSTSPVLTSTTSNVNTSFSNLPGPGNQQSNISINVPSGTFGTNTDIFVTSTTDVASITPSGTQVVADSVVNFSGTPQKQMTLTIHNSNIHPGDVVYKVLPDGTYQQLPNSDVNIIDGQAVISFQSDPTFVITTSTRVGGPVPPTIIQDFFTESAQVGQAYSTTIHIVGGIDPMKWTVTSGTLPPGLALSNQGVISGTPTTAGTAQFTVKVTDANNLSSMKQLSLTVTGATSTGGGSTASGGTETGTSTSTPPTTPVSVTTVNERSVTIGHAVNVQLKANGGQTPYTWSTVNSLPKGLSLNPTTGMLSGTPDTPGVHQVIIKVTGAKGTTSQQTLTLDVLQPYQREVLWNGTVKNVPAIVQPEGTTPTTYMPIWYVMQLLKPMGITSTWDGKQWHMTTGGQVGMSNLSTASGNTGIYLNGTLVQKVNTLAANDPSTGQATTYMPIWYVMQLLKRVGLRSSWDGTTWTVTK